MGSIWLDDQMFFDPRYCALTGFQRGAILELAFLRSDPAIRAHGAIPWACPAMRDLLDQYVIYGELPKGARRRETPFSRADFAGFVDQEPGA